MSGSWRFGPVLEKDDLSEEKDYKKQDLLPLQMGPGLPLCPRDAEPVIIPPGHPLLRCTRSDCESVTETTTSTSQLCTDCWNTKEKESLKRDLKAQQKNIDEAISRLRTSRKELSAIGSKISTAIQQQQAFNKRMDEINAWLNDLEKRIHDEVKADVDHVESLKKDIDFSNQAGKFTSYLQSQLESRHSKNERAYSAICCSLDLARRIIDRVEAGNGSLPRWHTNSSSIYKEPNILKLCTTLQELRESLYQVMESTTTNFRTGPLQSLMNEVQNGIDIVSSSFISEIPFDSGARKLPTVGASKPITPPPKPIKKPTPSSRSRSLSRSSRRRARRLETWSSCSNWTYTSGASGTQSLRHTSPLSNRSKTAVTRPSSSSSSVTMSTDGNSWSTADLVRVSARNKEDKKDPSNK